MAQVETDIANGALLKLGHTLINSLDDKTKAANGCKARIQPVKRAVFRLHPWNFAIKRVNLAPVSGATPAFNYTYEFQLPSDLLRVIKINDGEFDYRIEGLRIITNESAIQLRYVYDADISAVDSIAAEAISAYLAWDLCYFLTQSDSKKESLWKDFERILGKARYVDATEEPAESIEATDWTNARINGLWGASDVQGFVRDPGT